MGSQIQMHCRVRQAQSAWDPWHYPESLIRGTGASSHPHPESIIRGTGAASHAYPESIIRGTGAASDPDTESTIAYHSTGADQMLFGTIPQIQMHCQV